MSLNSRLHSSRKVRILIISVTEEREDARHVKAFLIDYVIIILHSKRDAHTAHISRQLIVGDIYLYAAFSNVVGFN